MNLYPYYGLPKFWKEQSLKNLVNTKTIRPDIAETLNLKLSATPSLKAVKVFVQNNAGAIAHTLTDVLNTPLQQIYGVDFINYFRQTLKSDETFELPLDKHIFFVYNVGKEPAVKREFSCALLKGLVQQMLDRGAVVFIQSDLPYSKFTVEYDWVFENRLNIPYPNEEKVF
jgi:hypothetical protein